MRNLEDDVRDAVLALAEDAPPPDNLAVVARARGTRMRRRRHAAIGAAALALAGVTVTPYALLRQEAPGPAPQPAATVSQAPSPAPTLPPFSMDSPYRLPGGAVITALTGTTQKEESPGIFTPAESQHVVFDPAAARFNKLNGDFRAVVTSPDGDHYAAYGGTAKRVQIFNSDGKPARYLNFVPYAEPQWSPDSGQLLVPADQGFYLTGLDQRTGLRGHDISGCPDMCSFSWLPNGTEIAVTRRDTASARDENQPDKVGSIDVYSVETGKWLRTLPITGTPLGTRGWSPDGKHVLVHDDGPVTLVDAVDGSEIAELAASDGMFLPDGRILVIDDEFVQLYDARGRLLQEADLPNEFGELRISAGRP